MLLKPEELVDITGYRRPKDQVAWIREKYGIPAHVNAANEAIVVRAHLEAASSPAAQNAGRVRTVRKAA
jgi:hypothetical protein